MWVKGLQEWLYPGGQAGLRGGSELKWSKQAVGCGHPWVGVPCGLECLVLAQEEKGPESVWEDTREGGTEVEMGGALGRQR